MHIDTVGEENGEHFFAMEYIEGEPLSKRLDEKKILPLDEALRITVQIMSALQKVHNAGIVYRDLKPGNIMIDNDGRAILVDFGLSKDITEDSGLTTLGS